MSGKLQEWREHKTAAHAVPFFAFLAFMSLGAVQERMGLTSGFAWDPWWKREPNLWIYPLQTVCIGAMLAFFWRNYTFRPVRGILLASVLGLLGILLWIAPGHVFWAAEMKEGWWKYFGFTDRSGVDKGGFDPNIMKEEGAALYWGTVLFRFFRMVVVVALVEEIFWRGFLMRYVLDFDGDFWKQPFGKASVVSFLVVTGLVTVVHSPADWLAAFFWGSLVYFLAVRAKSLFACVWMHAVANLVLGVYVMVTEQWGY
ncbi:MAG: CAAX prenyl protease-related protein, partial [Verrucomicrobiota bacterium]